jgi:hypothetical protein
MPIVKTVKGNIVEMLQEKTVRLVALPANCVREQEGLTAAVMEAFPDLDQLDKDFPLPSLYRLGDYSMANLEGSGVLLFYTSLDNLKENKLEFSALKSCLKKLSMEAINGGNYIELAFPKLNENWEIAKKILSFQEHLLITVIEND